MTRKGFTLAEVAVALAVVGIMTAVALGMRKRTIAWSRAKQTAMEMVAVREAGITYYWKNGAFPSAVSNLSGYLSPHLISSPTNPYGFSYTVSATGLRFQVTTTIPKSAPSPRLEQLSRTAGSTNDTITTSGVVNMGSTGGIIFETDHGWAAQ